MRPRLFPGTHLLPSDQGVVIRGPRHTAAFPMPGIYPWLERIRPFLDGRTRLDELVADLPPQAAQHVRTLVELLAREGFVRDAEGDLAHGLSPDLCARHSALVDFIALRADSPEHRFERYRNCSPVVIGSGLLASALVLALVTSGVEHVRFCIAEADDQDEYRTDSARLDECVELLQKDGLSFRYEAMHGEPEELPTGTGTVLLACDEFEPELAVRVHAFATRAGLGYGQLTASDQHAFINTTGDVAGEATSYRRDAAGRAGGSYLGGPTAALAANQLCLQLLCRTAGLDEQPTGDGAAAPGLAVLDLVTARFLAARPA